MVAMVVMVILVITVVGCYSCVDDGSGYDGDDVGGDCGIDDDDNDD